MQTKLVQSSLGIQLKAGGRTPLYRQLFDAIVSRIQSGTFPAGYRLPPTRQLADELSTHRNTVVRAYEDLVSSGFAESTVGRGTFVATAPARLVPVKTAHTERPPLPWSSLLSSAITNDTFARAERFAAPAAGPDAIHLARMQPVDDLLPHDLLRRCIDRVLHEQGPDALGYSGTQGLPKLRALIAEDLGRQGVPAAAEDIIVTSGSQQALDLVSRAFIARGDTFLVDEATYGGALRLLAAAGARLVPVPCDDEGPDIAALDQLGRGAKGIYVMPNCQNPTGRRISLARRQALVDWSHRAGVPIIEDDYAADLNLDGKPPVAAMRTLDGEVLYLGTYSKKLIPALRIGYLLAPRALRGRLELLKHSMDLGTSPLLQHTLAEFLSRGYLEAHLKKVVPKYRARRDALETALRKSLPSHVSWRSPETGLALWIPLPHGPDPEALWHEAQRHGVIIGCGALNGVTEAGQKGIRLTYCAEPPGRLVEGARRLGKAFAALERRPAEKKTRTQLEVA
jgi:DNA-binding transcriptional MocR family regulator